VQGARSGRRRRHSGWYREGEPRGPATARRTSRGERGGAVVGASGSILGAREAAEVLLRVIDRRARSCTARSRCDGGGVPVGTERGEPGGSRRWLGARPGGERGGDVVRVGGRIRGPRGAAELLRVLDRRARSCAARSRCDGGGVPVGTEEASPGAGDGSLQVAETRAVMNRSRRRRILGATAEAFGLAPRRQPVLAAEIAHRGVAPWRRSSQRYVAATGRRPDGRNDHRPGGQSGGGG
jgi:hypothetical protein